MHALAIGNQFVPVILVRRAGNVLHNERCSVEHGIEGNKRTATPEEPAAESRPGHEDADPFDQNGDLDARNADGVNCRTDEGNLIMPLLTY